MLDALKPITHKRLIEHELEGFGIRLNKTPPKSAHSRPCADSCIANPFPSSAVTFKKKERGGVSFASTVHTTHLDQETVTSILKEYRINSADVRLQGDYTDEELIDVIEGNRIYIPCSAFTRRGGGGGARLPQRLTRGPLPLLSCVAVYVCNKIDQISLEELELLDRMPHYCPVSAHAMWNMDGLLEARALAGKTREERTSVRLTPPLPSPDDLGVPGPGEDIHQAQGAERGAAARLCRGAHLPLVL